jgi:WD40 repeat protein
MERALRLPAGTHLGIVSVAVSPSDRSIAVGGHDGAQIWQVGGSERATSPFLRNRRPVTSLAFSADERTLLVGSADHTLRRWLVPDGQAIGGSLTHATVVSRVASSPDGRFLATAQDGGLVRIWAAPADGPQDYPLPVDGFVSRGTLSPDGRHVLPTGDSNWNCSVRSTQVHDVATGRPAGPVLAGGGILMDAAFSPDGRQVAALISLSGSREDRRGRAGSQHLPGQLKLWDWRTGELTGPPLTLPSEPHSLAYRPDGQVLAVLCAEGQALLIEAGGGRIVAQWEAFQDRRGNVSSHIHNDLLRFSPDGKCLVTLSRWHLNSIVRVWDATSGRERYPGLAHRERCQDAQFSPDGRWLVTASADSSVRLWDVATGQPLADPLVHPAAVSTAVFSPDGTRVLTGCDDGMARLWDWRAGRTLWTLQHEHTLNAVAFHPNGRWVLTTSADGTFRVWDGRTSKPLTPPLSTGGTQATSVAVTPDGNQAVVGDYGGSGNMSALWVFSLGSLSAADSREPDELCAWGELLSGKRVHESSGVTTLTPEEWLARWRAFRQRHPDHGLLGPTESLAHSWRAAGAAEAALRWQVAVKHLDPLIVAHPTVSLLYDRRGDAYSARQQWDKAAPDYARASELRPDDIEMWQERTHVCLGLGDDAGYRRICAEVLERFAGSVSVPYSVEAAWLCTLRPNAVPEPARLLRLMEKANAEGPTPYHRMVLGAVLHRAGRSEEAIQQLNAAKAATNNGDGGHRMWLFLALAHHHVGHAAEARQWLDKAILWEAKQKADGRVLAWGTREPFNALRREAEELITGKAAEPKD